MAHLPPPPWGHWWRSARPFVIATVGIGLFSDLFLYGIVVPVIPFLLRDRLGVVDDDAIQTQASRQLAAYAGSSVLFAVPVGWAADRFGSRKIPFLTGVVALLTSTAMLCAGTSTAVLMAARLLQGISVAVVWAVGFATVQDLVGTSELGRVTGIIYSFVSVGELVAPALGGFLLDKMEMDNYKVVPDLDKDQASSESRDSLAAQECPINASETSPLLERSEELGNSIFRIPENSGWLSQHLPVLFCIRNTRLSMAMTISLVQGVSFGVIDATVPIELSKMFSFSSKEVGLVFVCMMIPFVGLGQPAGWAADRYGAKALAMTGYLLLVPAFGLLSLPSLKMIEDAARVPYFCATLAFNGLALALISPVSSVEAGTVIESYHKANPGFFGEHGPYAQLHGLNSVFFFSGLAIGPLAGGWLNQAYGFHTMALVIAVVAAIMFGLVARLVGGINAS
ncbi:putative MFS-type transporter [Beauveria bassiana]|nr:putative MFS-type transporter [Beauveria bassiana]